MAHHAAAEKSQEDLVPAPDYDGPPSEPSEIDEPRHGRLGEKPHNRAEAVLEEAQLQTAAGEGEDEIEYPKAFRLLVITVALCLSVFCMALDNTIIATAIPKITDEFHSIGDVGWYGSAYLLTTCGFQLAFGRLYSMYSIKWTYLVALLIFEIGSAVCGAAPTSTGLIVGRAVAGLGAAGVFSGAILIVAHTVPLDKRPIYTGIIGGMYGIASVAGPLLGGAFTQYVSWRWCFYINLPIGALTAGFIIIFFVSPVKAAASNLTLREQLRKFDFIGTGVFLPGVVCILLALQWGGSVYAWNNWRIILLLVLFAVLIIIFVGIQFWKGENGTVPPRVFKVRATWSAAVFAAFLGASFFAMVYYVPIWFQAIQGATPEESGIRNLPLILSVVVASLVGGVLTTVIGYYTPFFIVSPILIAVGGGIMSTWLPNTPQPQWIGYQIVYGFGVGIGMQQSIIAVQAALPLADVPIGTAIVMFSQTFGGALFISVAQNIFSNKIQQYVTEYAPSVPPGVVLSAGATNIRGFIGEQFPAALDGVLLAYNNAIVRGVFYVGCATGAVAIIPGLFQPWISVKGKKIDAAGGA